MAHGTLVQMVLEDRPEEEIARFIRFYRTIRMPVTLKELHLDSASCEDLLKVGKLANAEGDTLRNLAADLAGEEIADAILAVDALAARVK